MNLGSQNLYNDKESIWETHLKWDDAKEIKPTAEDNQDHSKK